MNKQELKEYLKSKIEKGNVENTFLFYGEEIEEFENEILLFLNELLYFTNKKENEVIKEIDFLNKADLHILDLNCEEKINKKNIIKIGDVKEFFEKVYEKPKNINKVFYIKNGNLMNINAQNAILKIIEEPPSNTYIVISSNTIENILTTIKSRCSKIYVSNGIRDKAIKISENNLFYDIINDISRLSKLDFYLKYSELIEKDLFLLNLKHIEEVVNQNMKIFLEKGKEKQIYLFLKTLNESKKRYKKNCNFKMIKNELIFGIYEDLKER